MSTSERPQDPAAQFRHEQLLRINEPGNALLPALARPALWAGLLEALRAPEQHDPTLDASVIVEVTPTVWRRRSARGRTVIAERIELEAQSAVHITVEEGPFSGSYSDWRIEEPAPGALFVRIVHVVHGPTVALSPEEQSARAAAYEALNVDRVSHARAAALR